MKRIIAISAFAIALTMLGLAFSQSPNATTSKPDKVLVKSLPKGIQGLELVGATVKLKSGYKFVKHVNGTVTVDLMRGGGGGLNVGGTWNCNCKSGSGAGGTCTVKTDDSSISCINMGTDTCPGVCKLIVTTNVFSGGVVAY
jgi:hypothetical protein